MTHTEHVEVLIVGAGISGIGAAYYLQTEHPARRYAILESRGATGGTWDHFRYPGIRSDSDLHTFAYEFKPWRDDHAIATADKILAYLRETVSENRIDRHIRFHHKVLGASWDSETARWTVDVEREGAERVQFTADWLFCGGGYYRYDEGFTPEFDGIEKFTGRVVHPQLWPEDLDYAGKKVIVIGSGATAVTVVPSMAQTAAHVTMLQRSPTYMLPVLAKDHFANTAIKLLGAERGYALARRKNIAKQRSVYTLCQRYPRAARKVIGLVNASRLPKGYPVDEHFSPAYNPWDQRLCAVPNGDMFAAIKRGAAEVVTDRIEAFTERGIRLASGRELEADIIVTATGLNIQLFGGMALTVDGRPVDLARAVAYKGMMLSGVPNFVFAFGYTNSSWTLKIGLICEHLCRMLTYMDDNGFAIVRPEFPGGATRPLIDFSAGYIQRVADQLPRQGVEAPWQMTMNYTLDRQTLRNGPVTDPALRFERTATRIPATSSPGAPDPSTVGAALPTAVS